jgi:predicted DNA-binding transcriptional regulator YafY
MKLQRLIAILTVLLRQDRISATALAKMFEVSVRTIYRDVEALESAGIPIVTHTGVNGGIAIIAQYKIDKKLFTHQDISTLLTSLYSVSGSIPDSKLNQTLEKIKSLIPEGYGRAIELTSKQLHIDLTPWSNHPRISEALKQVQRALAENRVIQFSYTARHEETTERTAEPHQLVLKENNWYLRAFCLARQDFRTFKLHRMDNIILLQQQFEPREFETVMTDFKDWKNDKLITVELIVDSSLRERALDYCRDECMEDLTDGRIHIKMPFVESEIGYSVLLGMGHQCEVISPSHIRAEVIRRIALMKAVYG